MCIRDRILAVTIYPLTPNPDDIIEVMELDNEVYLFSDVQALGCLLYTSARGYPRRRTCRRQELWREEPVRPL